MTSNQKIVEAQQMVREMDTRQTPEQVHAWKLKLLKLLNDVEFRIVYGDDIVDAVEAREELERQDIQREFNWKVEREIDEGKTA